MFLYANDLPHNDDELTTRNPAKLTFGYVNINKEDCWTFFNSLFRFNQT